MLVRCAILACSLHIALASSAQLVEHYFADGESKDGTSARSSITAGDHILVGGHSYAGGVHKPSMTLVDTLGNVVWTTALADTQLVTDMYNQYYVDHVLDGGDGYYYGCLRSTIFVYQQLWKVDAATGAIVWKRDFEEDYAIDVYGLDTLDGERLVFSYYTNAHVHLKYIDRATGDVPLDYDAGFVNNSHTFDIAVDHQQHIYYSKGDSIFKASLSQPGDRLWSRKYDDEDVKYVNKLHMDENDSLFAIGLDDGGSYQVQVLNLRTDNGEPHWHTTTEYGSEYQDLEDRNGSLYLTRHHKFTNGGRFTADRIDKSDGEILWTAFFINPTVGTPQDHSGDSEGAVASDLDEDGDLYMTGYYGDPNWGPEVWVIAKVNGSDGSMMYSRTITETPEAYNDLSNGYGAHVINGMPCFVGDLESYHGYQSARTRATFVRLEPDSGTVLIQKPFNGEEHFPSRTIDIQRGPAGTYALKQVGRSVVVELYAPDNTLSWSRMVTRDYFFRAGQLAVGVDGSAWFTGRGFPIDAYVPYYSPAVDSLHVIRFDPNGELALDVPFAATLGNERLMELVVDTAGNAFVGIARYQALYIRSVIDGVVSGEQVLSYNYEEENERTGKLLDKDADELRLINNKSSYLQNIAIDKNTLQATVLDTLYGSEDGVLPQQVERVPGERLLISAHGDDISLEHHHVSLYSLATQDTLWRHISEGNPPTRVAWAGQSVFTASTLNDTVTVERLSAATGELIWRHRIDGPGNGVNKVYDLEYDAFRNELIIAGHEVDTANGDTTRNVIIQRLDTSGALLEDIYRLGGPYHDNGGICARTLANGSVWVGGALDTTGLGRAGFIYELQDTLNTDLPDIVFTRPRSITVWPQPIDQGAWVSLPADFGAAQLLLFDVQGRELWSLRSRDGAACWLARGDQPSGLYLLRAISDDGRRATARVVLR